MEFSETNRLEWKREVTGTFLKTVSAYANDHDGEILFGVDDHGVPVGIKDVKAECLRIEQMINDSLEPVPEFRISVSKWNEQPVITLMVKKGKDKPYFYNGKAYKRSDTSTVEVSRYELRRLALEGLNMSHEERKASSQELTFRLLESKLQEAVGVTGVNTDVLRTLNLVHKDGYFNVAAELLADVNTVPFSGTDIARFGRSINQILFRETVDKRSLLGQYDRAMEIYELFYSYEEIEGAYRVRKELLPREAFREAVANALVHRVWDVNSYVRIAMFADRIEITSPGGLPDGLTTDDYLHRSISTLRNPILAGVFFRLHMIESFGSGISRIIEAYHHNLAKPDFTTSGNFIRVILPVLFTDPTVLSRDEEAVYNLLSSGSVLSREYIDSSTGFHKSKTIRVIDRLSTRGLVMRLGEGPATRYRVR